MKLRLTHLLFTGEARPPDALATSVEEPSRRFFVPGWIPCGECGRCRRGLMAACPRGRALEATPPSPPVLELADRFVAAVDDPPGASPLADARAVAAGVVAEVQEVAARAGLGTGDVAVWIGDDARSTLGARLSAARGCTTFQLGASGEARAAVTRLSLSAGPEVWAEALTAAASAAPGGFQERRLFVARAEEALVSPALTLIAPGATLSLLDGRGPVTLQPRALLSCRIIVAAGFGYHPDLVSEAMAALRTDETLTAGLIVEATTAEGRDQAALTLVALG